MATSGSVDFSLTCRQVINEAMTLIGQRTEGMPALPAYDAEEARNALNLMLKSWSVKLRQWLQTESTITPIASTASYALASKAYTIQSIRRRRSNIDTPLIQLSREEYFSGTPSKAATGVPNSFYYDPQRATGTVYLWPAPNADFVSNWTLRYTYTRQIEDVDSLDNDLDVPQEWLEAVCYSLADRLAIRYPALDPQQRADIKERAAILYQGLADFDQEDTSVFLQPSMR
jgi:hypothetical protein